MIVAPLEQGWPVNFSEVPDGGCPVRDFLLRLPLVERAQVVGLIDRLRAHGPTVPFPYSSQAEGKISSSTVWGPHLPSSCWLSSPPRSKQGIPRLLRALGLE